MSELVEKAQKLKSASKRLAMLTTEEKNDALAKMADQILTEKAWIIQENAKDIQYGKENGFSASLLDRLLLTDERIEQIADGIRQVISLEDPVGEIIESWKRPNGLEIQTVRVPLGVIGMVYEARPNVTVDAACL